MNNRICGINFTVLILYQKIKNPAHQNNIIARVKAVKNDREIKGFKESHIRDATAMAIYFS